jgi:hypothetical protein
MIEGLHGLLLLVGVIVGLMVLVFLFTVGAVVAVLAVGIIVIGFGLFLILKGGMIGGFVGGILIIAGLLWIGFVVSSFGE